MNPVYLENDKKLLVYTRLKNKIGFKSILYKHEVGIFIIYVLSYEID